MAVRCVLGKLGMSSKCIHDNGRLMTVGNLVTSAINYKHNNNAIFGGRENLIPIPKRRKKHPYDYHMDLGGVGPGRFATQEFNQRKLVRVLRASRWPWADSSDYWAHRYSLMLEAVNAGVVKFYLANVSVDLLDGMQLKSFYLVDDNEFPVRLYHHLDNFFDE